MVEQGFYVSRDDYCKLKKERDQLLAIKKKYEDLILCVGIKHPNETRHETAKRYLLQAEKSDDVPTKAIKPSRVR